MGKTENLVQEKHKSKRGHVVYVEYEDSKVNLVTVRHKRMYVTKNEYNKPELDKNKSKKPRKILW